MRMSDEEREGEEEEGKELSLIQEWKSVFRG